MVPSEPLSPPPLGCLYILSMMYLTTYLFALACLVKTPSAAAFLPHPRALMRQRPGAPSVLCKASTMEPPARTAQQTETTSTEDLSPAEIENGKFDCEDNVKFWQDFQRNGFESTQENAQQLAAVASRFVAKGPDGIDFWMRHVARSGYFTLNALLGTTGSSLHERLVGSDSADPNDKGFVGPLVNGPTVSRLMLEAALSYEQDYERIQAGKYKKPYDMYEPTRQSSPLNIVTQTARFIDEAISTLARRKRQEKDIWISDAATPDLYPDYYQTAFHYQTDGWMSKKSAQVYETSTETLFLGRQDAMQRTALGPLVANKPKKILEVACGTGRFMTFVRDNLPLDSEYTAIDLSPFYLESARENDDEWRRVRSKETGETIAPARLVQAQAENLPFADNEFDAVLCVYLFHELPRDVREQVAAEMARVVRPGGSVVFTDSVQRGDRPVFDAYLGEFRENERALLP
jgi:ubiquinone/menaquinone biosynthesis C-methylase UbiE